MNVIGQFFKRPKATSERMFYVHGSGLIRIPIGRVNEVPKVIQEFHEDEAARVRIEAVARR